MTQMDPVPMMILLLSVGLAFVLMCAGMGRCLQQLHAYRRELVAGAKTLRLHGMLVRLGVSVQTYVKRTPAIEVEKHLYQCQRCTETGACDDFLERRGERSPDTFCPNMRDFRRHQRRAR